MSENLKGDRESKNEAIQIESTRLEKRDFIANIESKRDTKNKDKVRLDSNGDEIMYEVRHKLNIKDTIQYLIIFILGIVMVYGGIKKFLSTDLAEQVGGIMLLIFGISCIIASCHRLFYIRKDRFYVTNSGIGFERRKWFRMQRIFFKFGEVGVIIYGLPAPLYFDSSTNIFIFCPIHLTIKSLFLARFRDKNYKHYIFREILTEFYLSEKIAILTFIRQKTKEALESQGIEISDSELKDKIKSLTNKDI